MTHPLAALALFATFSFPLAASAHVGVGATSGFAHGFLHPLSGLDHLLAMVAVGLLAALIGGSGRWLLPLVFPAVMAMGALVGVAGPVPSGTEALIGLSTVVLAGLGAWGLRLHPAVLVPFVGFFAFFHGLAHGAEMPADAAGLAYGAGFVVATALLHGVGLLAGARLPSRAGGFHFARGVAAMLAAAGLILVVWSW